MSKIICEVCGTSYPSTAAQCPICGCVKASGKQTVAGDTEKKTPVQNNKTRTPVKGGRYSKANVRKRNQASNPKVPERGSKSPEKNDKANRGLIILALVLLLTIAAMLLYIAFRFFVPGLDKGEDTTGTTVDTTAAVDTATGDTTVDTTAADLSCTDLTLSNNVVELTTEGQAWLLNVSPVPADTTDPITYASSDESVATVSAQGKVVAIAPGQALITITCGDVEKTCRIIVAYEEETTAPPETTEADTTAEETDEELKLNREDFTMSYQGEEWQLYNGSIAKPLITWSSADESVATIENGKVVAVGPGMTKVYGEYNGQKVSCIVRCSFEVDSGDTSDGGGFNTGVGEDSGAVG